MRPRRRGSGDGRVPEGGGLPMRLRINSRIGGSNPPSHRHPPGWGGVDSFSDGPFSPKAVDFGHLVRKLLTSTISIAYGHRSCGRVCISIGWARVARFETYAPIGTIHHPQPAAEAARPESARREPGRQRRSRPLSVSEGQERSGHPGSTKVEIQHNRNVYYIYLDIFNCDYKMQCTSLL